MRQNHFKNGFLSILTILFLFLVISTATGQSSTQTSITITQPPNDSSVNQKGESVVFQSTVPIQNDDKPVLFIKDPLGSWWPHMTAKATSNDRTNWIVDVVQFGEQQDGDLDFKLQVIVLPENVLDDGVTIQNREIYIESGEILKSKEMRALKSMYPTVSNVVKVTRN